MVHTLPTTTISLNSKQRNLIKAGLDVLAARHGGALLGHYPYRHPWHRVNLQASDIYRGKVYNAMMAGAFISLRTKLSHAANHRINANAFEMAAAAFVVRVTREKRLEEQNGSSQVTADGTSALNFPILEQKLEIARRRARHAAIKQVGEITYDGLWKTWDRFLQWMRYFLLYGPQYISGFRLLRQPGIRMRIWKYQRDEIIALAERVIGRRSYTKVEAGVMRKNVDLAISELRRGRYPGLTVMTVIHQHQLGADFIFDFLSARIDLEPLKPVADWYERVPLTAEKFKVWLPVVKPGQQTSSTGGNGAGQAGTPAIESQHTSNSTLPASTSKQTVPFARPIPLTDSAIADAVAMWLTTCVPPGIWEAVIKHVQFLIQHDPALFRPMFTSAESLEELIDLCRPKQNPPDPWEDPPALPKQLNEFAAWLLGWMTALKGDNLTWDVFAWHGYGIVRAGLGRAKKAAEAPVLYT